MSSPDPALQQHLLVDARRAAEHGHLDEARAAYGRLLDHSPENIEALNFLAMLALSDGRPVPARQLLQRALAAAPDDGPTRKNLGVVLLQTGNPPEAEQVLREAVQLDPAFFVARLYLGVAHERLGNTRAAIVEYFKAIATAQAVRQWSSPATTPVGLRPVVEHAMVVARRGRRQLLAAVLARFHDRFGHQAMERMDRCLSAYLGDVVARPPDPLQKPEFLYFPDLPSKPFLPRGCFPWYDDLEAATDDIRGELLSVLGDQPQLEPFLGAPPPGMKSSYLDAHGDADAPRWDAFFFHRHGRRYDQNCGRCPATAAALDRTPLVHIHKHAPEALFSVLGPGSHILPHYGVTNTRVVTHLPLVVPAGCELRVAGERHAWQPGRCVTFDDTFEHEAWNNSDQTRVILLFDVWNPYLTDAERTALAELVPAIGELTAEAI